jgi:hypothetical protein
MILDFLIVAVAAFIGSTLAGLRPLLWQPPKRRRGRPPKPPKQKPHQGSSA